MQTGETRPSLMLVKLDRRVRFLFFDAVVDLMYVERMVGNKSKLIEKVQAFLAVEESVDHIDDADCVMRVNKKIFLHCRQDSRSMHCWAYFAFQKVENEVSVLLISFSFVEGLLNGVLHLSEISFSFFSESLLFSIDTLRHARKRN